MFYGSSIESLSRLKFLSSFFFVSPHQHGITQANELVNLNEFFVNHILSDLKSPNGTKALARLLAVLSLLTFVELV